MISITVANIFSNSGSTYNNAVYVSNRNPDPYYKEIYWECKFFKNALIFKMVYDRYSLKETYIFITEQYNKLSGISILKDRKAIVSWKIKDLERRINIIKDNGKLVHMKNIKKVYEQELEILKDILLADKLEKDLKDLKITTKRNKI